MKFVILLVTFTVSSLTVSDIPAMPAFPSRFIPDNYFDRFRWVISDKVVNGKAQFPWRRDPRRREKFRALKNAKMTGLDANFMRIIDDAIINKKYVIIDGKAVMPQRNF